MLYFIVNFCSKLDILFEAEEKIMNNQASSTQLIELMRNCTGEDALRVMMISYLCSSNVNEVLFLFSYISSLIA